MSKKLSLKLNKDNFSDFISKILDVSNVSDVIKIKIDKDNTLIYGAKMNNNIMLALKSYYFPTSEIIENFSEDEMYNLILFDAPKLIKGIKNLDINNTLKLDLNVKPKDGYMQVRSVQFTSGKLKIQAVGGEDKLIKDIPIEHLNKFLNLDNSKFKFDLQKQDLIDMKKLSAIYNDEKNTTVTLNIVNGKITSGEYAKWELEIGETDSDVNAKIVFNKKYLTNINKDLDIINFYMFETFLLVKDITSNLMLSYETDFSD